MTRLSRRSLLRSGTTLVLATTIAGCSGATDSIAMANGDIPGVEDGEIVDHHTFANAHGDQLATRTGTLEWARTSLDRETGDSERHTVWTVRVEGNHVHAVVSGRTLIGKPDVDRLEIYFNDDSTIFLRTRTDGEWTTTSGEPHEIALSKGSFTGTSRLEEASMRKVGAETVNDEELYRFSNMEGGTGDEEVEWFDVHAFVDEDALVHRYQQTLAGTERNTHTSEEWYLTDLGSTTVERPDWVAEADA
ncbi:DUF7537 family lipoprotein [Halorussus amylolyticus]|uniref:DUF7537 family lipoprotein n=1 Tax=Halorussus amylolyticus TaxID=1126242 RepID=UPI00138F5144|nr:hypothetical protein [Halorussus amylolyticus]